MSDRKPTNPKDALAVDKLPLHLWPAIATAYGCLAGMNGHEKYGFVNWRESGVRFSVYYSALLRHAAKWYEGEEVDEEGVPHASSMLMCIAILLDARAHGHLVDDRPIGNSDVISLELNMLTDIVPQIRKRHADKNPHHHTRLSL